MTMCMAPAYILSILAVLVNAVGATVALCLGQNPFSVALTLTTGVAFAYSVLFVFSLMLTISEWKRLRAHPMKKILFMFSFPIYMFTFIPICFLAIFKRTVKWTPIIHENKVSMDDLAKK